MNKRQSHHVRIKKQSYRSSSNLNQSEKSNWLRIIYLTLLLSSSRILPQLMQLHLSLLFLLFSSQVLACHSKHLSLNWTFLVLALPPKKMGSTSKESNAIAITSTTTTDLPTQFRLLCSSSIRTHLCLHFSSRNTPSRFRSKTAILRILVIQIATTTVVMIITRTNFKAKLSSHPKSQPQDSKCRSWSNSNSNLHNRIWMLCWLPPNAETWVVSLGKA